MSSVKLTSFGIDHFSTNRSSETVSSLKKERRKKLSTSYQYGRSNLSPLHLAHKTLDEIDFKGLSIGLIRLQSRGTPLQASKQAEPKPVPEDFLNKHYNFTEHKRISTRLDFTKLKKISRPNYIIEKYSIISKNQRFAGRSPLKSHVIKGILPASKTRTMSLLNDKNIRLRINGIMKSFSPRDSSLLLEPAIVTFSK